MRLRRGVMVLWRGPGISQVGVARPLVMSGLSAHDQQALAALEASGLGSLAKLSHAGRAAVASIEKAGLLESSPPALLPSVGIHGVGAVGLGVALALARAGHSLTLHDAAPVGVEPAGTFGLRPVAPTCAGAAADAIRAAVPHASVRVGADPCELTVVVGVGATDPASWVPLMAADKPYLLITTDEAGAYVGPLVLPGRTACGACLGLALAEVDHSWPLIALQSWSGRRAHLTADVAAVVGGLAAAMISALCAGRAFSADNAKWAVNAQWRCESGKPPTPRPVWPHPDCGCGAAESDTTETHGAA